MLKNIILRFLSTILFFLFFLTPLYAKTDSTKSIIPEKMMPNSTIIYTSDSKYVVLSGGEIDRSKLNEKGLTNFEQYYANLHLSTSLEYSNFDYKDINWVSNPEPTTGMIVEYDADGFIKIIKSSSRSTLRSALPIGSTSPVGVYVWGSLNNTLTVTTTKVRGTGRATTYGYTSNSDDVYDQYGNTLSKGDIATRQDYDNPAYGTSVIVVATRTDGVLLAKYMSKVDIGSLPNAIIDIWKDGAEYWGYTPNSSLSLYNVSYSYNR